MRVGRRGRLALRAAWERPEPALQLVHGNERKGGPETAAHLLEFDSVHGRRQRDNGSDGGGLVIDGQPSSFGDAASAGGVAWGKLGGDVVLECTGRFRTRQLLAPHFERGARKVVVAAQARSGIATELTKMSSRSAVRGVGFVVSGALDRWQGLTGCLWASVGFVLAAGTVSLLLPRPGAAPVGATPG